MRRFSCGKIRIALVLGGACALFNATSAHAGCWVDTTGVSFGAYDPQSAPAVDSAGAITLECDRRELSAIIGVGTGTSGSFSTREMRNGSDVLQYNVFTSSDRTQIWGDGSAGTGTVTVAPFPNRPITVTVYGRIPPSQNVSAGSYADTLIVTVEY